MIQQLCSVTTLWSAGIVLLFLALVYAMNRLPKKKFSFAKRVLIGSGCGSVFGLCVYYIDGGLGGILRGDVESWFSMIGNGYIALFKVLVVPAILIATVRLVLHTPAYKEVPKSVKIRKWVNTLMLALSASVSLVLGILLHVGSRTGGQLGQVAFQEGKNLPELFYGLVPSNVTMDILTGNVVAAFAVAVLTGIAARRMSGKYMDTVKPFFDLTEAAFSILGSVLKTVIAWKPAGAAAIMALFLGIYGPVGLWWILHFILVLILAAAVILLLQLILSAAHGVGPSRFIGAGRAAMIKAVKTCSGSACLPEAQAALSEGLGLNKEITDEVSAYAIASGMQGCAALFPALALVFTVNMAGVAWTPDLAVAAVVVIVAVSYGITGVPGTAMTSEFAAVLGTGLGGILSAIGPMIAIDPIGDVFRTLINVTGCMANAIIVERKVRE